MNSVVSIAAIVGPVYLVIGLSLLFYAEVWTKVVEQFQKNHFGMLTVAFMNLILGLMVIRSYNVWAWNLWVIITVTGWIMLVKGVFYFLAPGSWIKAVLKFKMNRSAGWIAFWGFVLIVVGAALTYSVYWNPMMA